MRLRDLASVAARTRETTWTRSLIPRKGSRCVVRDQPAQRRGLRCEQGGAAVHRMHRDVMLWRLKTVSWVLMASEFVWAATVQSPLGRKWRRLKTVGTALLRLLFGSSATLDASVSAVYTDIVLHSHKRTRAPALTSLTMLSSVHIWRGTRARLGCDDKNSYCTLSLLGIELLPSIMISVLQWHERSLGFGEARCAARKCVDNIAWYICFNKWQRTRNSTYTACLRAWRTQLVPLHLFLSE